MNRRYLLTVLLFLTTLTGGLAASVGNGSSERPSATIEFRYSGGNDFQAHFVGDCTSNGILFPHGESQRLSLVSEGGYLYTRQTWVDYNLLLSGALGDANSKIVDEQTSLISLPAGSLFVEWGQGGFGTAYGFASSEPDPVPRLFLQSLAVSPFQVHLDTQNVQVRTAGEPFSHARRDPIAWMDFATPDGPAPARFSGANQDLTVAGAPLVVDGTLLFYLREARWGTSEQAAQRLEPWIQEKQTELSAVPGSKRLLFTDGFLQLRNAHFAVDPHGLILPCEARRGELTGAYVLARAQGTIAQGDKLKAFDVARATLRGSFLLNERLEQDRDTGYVEGVAHAQGDVAVDGVIVDTASIPAPPSSHSPATLGWAALAIAGLWIGFKNAGTLVGFFYARFLGPQEVLQHPGRRRLVELLQSEPGLTITQLASRLGSHVTTVSYHVAVMRRNRLVRLLRYKDAVHVLPYDSRFPRLEGTIPREVILVDPRMKFLHDHVGSQSLRQADVVRLVSNEFGLTIRGARALVSRAVAQGVVRRAPGPDGVRVEIVP